MNLSTSLQLLLATLAVQAEASSAGEVDNKSSSQPPAAGGGGGLRRAAATTTASTATTATNRKLFPFNEDCPCFSASDLVGSEDVVACSTLEDGTTYAELADDSLFIASPAMGNSCSYLPEGVFTNIFEANLSTEQSDDCQNLVAEACEDLISTIATGTTSGSDRDRKVRELLDNWCVDEPILAEDEQLPLIAGSEIPCVKLSDLFVYWGVEQLPNSDEFTDSESESVANATAIFNDVITRIVELIAPGDVATDNFCFGNFNGAHFEGAADASAFIDPTATDGCHNLPLNEDSEYTIISGAITIPAGTCSNPDAKQATFCMAISYCPETNLPTIAVNVNDQTLSCVGDKVPIFGTTAAAFSNVAGDFNAGFGISLANQFHVDVILYTGLDDWDDKLITYPMTANYFDRTFMSIDPTKATGDKLSEIVLFNARGTRAAGIEGLDAGTIDGIFHNYEPEYDDAGDVVNDVIDSFLDFSTSVSVQAGLVADLQVSFDFSKLSSKSLTNLLPQSETYDLASANLFFQTAKTTRTVETINQSGSSTKEVSVRPGVYAFAGVGAIQNIAYGLFEYMMNFVQSIVHLWDKDFDWEALTAEVINENFDAGEDDSFGFGVSVTDKGFGIILNLPIALGDFGSFKAECRFEYDGVEMDCSTETDFFTLFWMTVWEEIEGEILYIAAQTTEAFEEAGTIIAASLVSATEEIEDVFSEENIVSAAEFVLDGLVYVGEEIYDWADGLLGDAYEDGDYCYAGTSCKKCKNHATWWYGEGKDGMRCGQQPGWDDGTYCEILTSCSVCEDDATWWHSAPPGFKCGTEPCWDKGTVCGTGTTCYQCCSGNSGADCPWYQLGVCTCGNEK